jgi:glyoxylase-like metal-dependent hydrolase (beta-lactamase superfamily II)
VSLAIPLAPGVFRIPTARFSMINTYALLDDEGVTLIDSGVDKAPPRIVAGLAEIGRHPSDVNRIVLTHAHPDHVGGAAELQRQTGAEVLTHDADREYAQAGRPPASDPTRLSGRVFRRLTRNARFEPVEVTQTLTDGQVLDIAGGLRVLHTPGHSPGHVSLLHEPTGVLITGDAIFNLTGMRLSPKFLCSDVRMTEQTAHVLGEVDYEIAAFTHGPEIRHQARERVRRLVSRFRREPAA